MKFRTDEIASVLRHEIASLSQKSVASEQIGRVVEVGDGVARVFGLDDVMAGEMLVLGEDTIGQALNLEAHSLGVVIYGDFSRVKTGDPVHPTGRLLEVPVGEQMIGRVVDPLGRPLDGGGPIQVERMRPTETAAPGIAERQPVYQPLQTGIKAVDSMVPVGRGQRELIIGDRKTGKTAIAIDAILNQAGGDVLCVYVAIGQKESTVAGIVEALRAAGAMKWTVVVAAFAASAAPLQYLAPYSGCTIAEHFAQTAGRHTLVVYDDLSKQATAYRQMSLVLRRPPGREAYPGDIFYLHARLLERACKLADAYAIVPKDTPADAADVTAVDGQTYRRKDGLARAEEALAAMPESERFRIHHLPTSGGSMTALPIVETLEGEISAYIPTNLISITDGQIYLEPALFFAGVRPAINVGVSVSRVGAAAQVKAMKQVSSSLRLDLAGFRELEAFAQLGTELGPASQRQLDRGARMVELLKQSLHETMPVVDQVISLFAGVNGYLDDIYLADVSRFEKDLLAFVKSARTDLYQELAAALELTDPRKARLVEAVEAFRSGFGGQRRRSELDQQGMGAEGVEK